MDFNSSGSLTMRYLNGPAGDVVDTVLARESSGGTIAWYLPDRLGTIRDLINNSGSIIDHVDYSAFGTELDESSPTNGDRMMGFAGMERDTVTGLNLAVNRVQNPGTGRWTSLDPKEFAAQDANLYRYVYNNASNGADPAGTGSGFLVFFPASESGEDESDLVGFISPILEPVLYSHSISGLVGHGLKSGQRHSGCNCGRVPSGFWRLSCWRRHRNKVGRSWTHWTSQRRRRAYPQKGR